MKGILYYSNELDLQLYEKLSLELSSYISIDKALLNQHDHASLNNDYQLAIICGKSYLNLKTEEFKGPLFICPESSAFGGLNHISYLITSGYPMGGIIIHPSNIFKLVSYLNIFLSSTAGLDKINILVKKEYLNYEYVNAKVEAVQNIADANNVDLFLNDSPEGQSFNLNLVVRRPEVKKQMFGLNIPILDQTALINPSTLLNVFHWMENSIGWGKVNDLISSLDIFQRFELLKK